MMSYTPVQEEQILLALRRLEPSRWSDVLDFIGFLRHQETPSPETYQPEPMSETTAGELLNSGLVGIWADRADIEDSTEYAQRLRRTPFEPQHWHP
jgi:hypothetical protein